MTKPKAKTKAARAQVTLVTVAVTTAGPVTMKAVRDAVSKELQYMVGWPLYFPQDAFEVTKVTVKRDANIERP